MVDEHESHSTDLSVSGEEGHSTILLAHYILWFYNWGQSCLATLVTPQNCPKMLILASDQKMFCFFEQLLSKFRYKKQLLLFPEQFLSRFRGGDRRAWAPTPILRPSEARRVNKSYFLGQALSYQGLDEQLPPLAWGSDHESVVLKECVFYLSSSLSSSSYHQ